MVVGEALKQFLGKDYKKFSENIISSREPETDKELIAICDECIKKATTGRDNFAREWEARLDQLAKQYANPEFKGKPAFIELVKEDLKTNLAQYAKEFK